MKIYTGENTGAGPQKVMVRNVNLVDKGKGETKEYELSPKLSQKLWNHSPDGFQWGYAGSGPAQLALAILLDFTGDSQLSLKLHQKFKFHIIVTAGNKLVITEAEIREWLDTMSKEDELAAA